MLDNAACPNTHDACTDINENGKPIRKKTYTYFELNKCGNI